jgi:RHS repeat-associated protein
MDNEAGGIAFGGTSLEDLRIEHEVRVDLATGAARVRLPLPLTPGRGDASPALALEYSSSSGNSPFGLGWSLAGLPAVGVSTRRRLPTYDARESYAFGGEELVPTLVEREGAWVPRTERSGDYDIVYYRARAERSFLRLERWTHAATGQVHWRSRDAGNLLTIYGLESSGSSRVADPDHPERVFLWLPDAQYDADGHAVRFEHQSEDDAGVDPADASESARIRRGAFAQRYLKRIRYGNTQPLGADAPEPAGNRWLFEAVLDYGDHDNPDRPTSLPDHMWPAREDPFSSFVAGFELRTWRLCRRILQFHHFEELGPGPTLVAAIELDHERHPAGSTLLAVRRKGYRRGAGGSADEQREVPSLRFAYTDPRPAAGFIAAPEETKEHVPNGITGPRYRFADLRGEGLPGILTETDDAWYFKRNEGGGRFGTLERVDERPAHRAGRLAFADFDQNGNPDLVLLQGRGAGFYEMDRGAARWGGFQAFRALPHLEAAGERTQWLDLNGDGRPDLVVGGVHGFTWYPSLGREGFGAAVEIPRADARGGGGPVSVADDPALDLFFADMNGDGLLDQVRIRNGRVEYWPHLGHGRFGETVVMDGAPQLASHGELDASRIRLVDLDGSGTSDLLYLGRGEIRWWFNAGGNRLVEGGRIGGLPFLDNLSAVRVLDFLGNGTPCLVWSSPLPGRASSLQYLPLADGVPPRLLVSVDDGVGREVRLEYSTSATHFLRDRHAGRPWISRIPRHPIVVDRVETRDAIGGGRSTSRYEYHDGRFADDEGVFLGFGAVDRYDAETHVPEAKDPSVVPACVRTWFHPGPDAWSTPWASDAYAGDRVEGELPTQSFDALDRWSPEECERGLLALAGEPIREEVFAVAADGSRGEHPVQVTRSSYRLRLLQPRSSNQDACVAPHLAERVTATYEQEAADPRVAHHMVLAVDGYGQVLRECSVAYARRAGRQATLAQTVVSVSAHRHRFVHRDERDRYELAIPVETEDFEVAGVQTPGSGLVRPEAIDTSIALALESPLAGHQPFAAGVSARRLEWDRTYYWNDDRSAALPLGEVGILTRLHHEEAACFTPQSVAEIYGDRVDAAFLESECGYVLRDGHWWQREPVHHFEKTSGFALPERVERWDGATTITTHDRYFLRPVEVTDAAGNRTVAEIDYHALAAWRITDPNDNIAEVRYDALGVLVAATQYGTALGADGRRARLGHEPLSAWLPPGDVTVEAMLAEPKRFLQSAARVIGYDLHAWANAGIPPRLVTITAEDLVHDGRGGSGRARIQTAIGYLDGFGEMLQGKVRVEPGPAVERGADGEVLVDERGAPLLAHADERWLVSGHRVRNTKQQIVREYEPFHSTTPLFEPDAALARFGVSSRRHYDAIGRVVREDLPNGAHTRTEHRAWETRSYDENDTVQESVYRLLRETLPNEDPEKRALLRTQAHADTPIVTHLDALGREVRVVEANGLGGERALESRLDGCGNALENLDPRGLIAFRHRFDMVGRELYSFSIDAGEAWTLPDAADRPIRCWTGRGVQENRSFDRLDRPTSLHVAGLPGLDHRVETMVYGDDPAVANATDRNARGRLVEHRDAAGLQVVEAYDAAGRPLRSTRRIRRDYRAEPNWIDPTAVELEPEVYVTSCEYDALGRAVSQSFADGTTRATEYLASGGVARVRISSADGALTDVAVLDGTAYNARAQRTRAVLNNGVVVEHTYHPETFRTARIVANRPAVGGTPARVYQDVAYTYDAVGNLVQTRDRVHEPGAPTPLIQGLAVPSLAEFSYDAFYQLREATGRVHQALLEHDYRPGLPHLGGSKGTCHLSLNNGAAVERYRRTYEYDAAGNLLRLRHIGASRNWTTDFWVSRSSNRSIPALDPHGNPVSDPEARFDIAGNCTFLPHLRRMDWNWRNILSRAVVIDRSAEGEPDDAEYYVHGGDGLRVRRICERVVAGGVEITEKLYLDGCEIRRVRRADTLLLERLTSHLSDGTGRVALIHRWTIDLHARETDDVGAVKIRYQLNNHLGTSVLELDAAAELITYEEYFPFGGTAFMAGDRMREVEIREYRYAGKEHDDGTGLYDFGHRLYASWMGRWLSPDPLGPVDGPNLYQYVRNDPVNLTDPDGLQSTATGRERADSVPVEYVTYESIPPQYRRGDDRLAVVVKYLPGAKKEEGSPVSFSSVEGVLEAVAGRSDLYIIVYDPAYDAALAEAGSTRVMVRDLLSGGQSGEEGLLSFDLGDPGEWAAENAAALKETGGGGTAVTAADGTPLDAGSSPEAHDTGSGGEAEVHAADGSNRRVTPPAAGTGTGIEAGGGRGAGKRGTGIGGGGLSSAALGSGFGSGMGTASGTGPSPWLPALAGRSNLPPEGGSHDVRAGVGGSANATPTSSQRGLPQGAEGGADPIPGVPLGTGADDSPFEGGIVGPGRTRAGVDAGTVQGASDGSAVGSGGARTDLDRASHYANYLNLEFDSAGGKSGGTAGGMLGLLDLGPRGQILGIVMAVIGAITLAGMLRKLAQITIKKVSKQGLKTLARQGVAQLRRVAPAARAALQATARTLRSVARALSAALAHVRGWKFKDWVMFWKDQGGLTRLNAFRRGTRMPRYRPIIYNYDLRGTPGRLDTAVHEAFHSFFARKFPALTWAQELRIPSRLAGIPMPRWAQEIPLGSPLLWVEETFAYAIGHGAVGRVHGVLFAPIEALVNLPDAPRLVTIIMLGLGGGSYGGYRLVTNEE